MSALTSGDGDLSEEEHRVLARRLYARWGSGESKSALEVEFWNDAASHGKHFTSYIRKWLGQETERKSGQSQEIERLRTLLRVQGVSPTVAGDLSEGFRLLARARESALAAVRVYNDPLSGFRTETFIVLMVIGWNSLLQALLERDGVDYFVRDQGRQVNIDGRPKVKETWELVGLALSGDDRAAMRANIDFFLKLRHMVAHRYLPALDEQVASEAQAMLLNFENLLVGEFWRRS